MKRRPRDVFDTLHQFDEPLLFTGANRGEPNAAVTDNDGCHAVTCRRIKNGVPSCLPVVMSVDINEAWRNNQSRCIDRFASVTTDITPDFNNDAILDGDVTDITWRASAIDNGSVDDF